MKIYKGYHGSYFDYLGHFSVNEFSMLYFAWIVKLYIILNFLNADRMSAFCTFTIEVRFQVLEICWFLNLQLKHFGYFIWTTCQVTSLLINDYVLLFISYTYINDNYNDKNNNLF